MDKTSAYVRTLARLHTARDRTREAFQDTNIPDVVHNAVSKTKRALATTTRGLFMHPENPKSDNIPSKYSYIFRRKSRWELILLSGTVCGIEFCYSAETAFVTPVLLSLGLNIKFVTMIWCLSPLMGFFLTPVMGSLSDSCESKFGRRRPFILLLSIGILIGLVLVPNGSVIGIALGDSAENDTFFIPPYSDAVLHNNETKLLESRLEFYQNEGITLDSREKYDRGNISSLKLNDTKETNGYHADSIPEPDVKLINATLPSVNSSDPFVTPAVLSSHKYETHENKSSNATVHSSQESHTDGLADVTESNSEVRFLPISIIFTVIGTVLLDFCSDSCQSPSRAYLLDVSVPDDHAVGLSTFTLMAGFGGSLGYLMGAVHWESTILGTFLGSQMNVVFTIVTIIFIICLVATISSFPEIPLKQLREFQNLKEYKDAFDVRTHKEFGNVMSPLDKKYSQSLPATEQAKDVPNGKDLGNARKYGSVEIETNPALECESTAGSQANIVDTVKEKDVIAIEAPTLKEYLKSIIQMPSSLRILCLTNLFCWMSLVCYSLYFTDFVAECVFRGDPTAPRDSEEFNLYKEGVRFGCWGMALYSISCSIYSFFIESMVKKFGAKSVYIGGQLVYSVGMIMMGLSQHKIAVILLSPTAGVMYSTLFTMPYLLIAHYHSIKKFQNEKEGEERVRGLGTDVATVSSMVFLSQFILSLSMGSIVEAVKSNVATVYVASVLSACGAICATQVLYLDM